MKAKMQKAQKIKFSINEIADLVIFIEKVVNGKLLCSEIHAEFTPQGKEIVQNTYITLLYVLYQPYILL